MTSKIPTSSHPQITIGDIFSFGTSDPRCAVHVSIVLVSGVEYSSFFDDDMIELVVFRHAAPTVVSFRKQELLRRFHKV